MLNLVSTEVNELSEVPLLSFSAVVISSSVSEQRTQQWLVADLAQASPTCRHKKKQLQRLWFLLAKLLNGRYVLLITIRPHNVASFTSCGSSTLFGTRAVVMSRVFIGIIQELEPEMRELEPEMRSKIQENGFVLMEMVY
ncbi:unnamed protein product [Eruca vesicaria subsp. sativa]|uniref:Uncharacterized protein n=1 Tax=Eruca vesicaria subsp. sativa TaxID=29727 RepID=A0ABC8M6R1_ERUVS|nr:unnamed protein product [Eruca vesicaria subsp. sativa]